MPRKRRKAPTPGRVPSGEPSRVLNAGVKMRDAGGAGAAARAGTTQLASPRHARNRFVRNGTPNDPITRHGLPRCRPPGSSTSSCRQRAKERHACGPEPLPCRPRVTAVRARIRGLLSDWKHRLAHGLQRNKPFTIGAIGGDQHARHQPPKRICRRSCLSRKVSHQICHEWWQHGAQRLGVRSVAHERKVHNRCRRPVCRRDRAPELIDVHHVAALRRGLRGRHVNSTSALTRDGGESSAREWKAAARTRRVRRRWPLPCGALPAGGCALLPPVELVVNLVAPARQQQHAHAHGPQPRGLLASTAAVDDDHRQPAAQQPQRRQ
eukprot:2465660-Prymnesium_polylepis.1